MSLKHIKQIGFATLIILTMLLLCSCSQKITDQDRLIKEIQTAVPDAEFVDVETENGVEEGELNKYYTFKNKDFSFVVHNSLTKDSVFGLLQNGYTHSYFGELLKVKESNIEKIAKDNNVTLYNKTDTNKDELDALKNKDGVLCICSAGNYEFSKSALMTFYIDNASQFDDINQFLNDIKKELKDYVFLKDTKMIKGTLTIAVCTNDNIPNKTYLPATVNKIEISVVKDKMDRYNTFADWSEYLYKNHVNDGNIKDENVDLTDFHPFKINKFYINDKLVESEKYEVEALYNLDKKGYYTPVCFGCKFDYNGGVEDYLQREIIQKCHSNSDYKIDEKKDTTTYKINGDKFSIIYNDYSKEKLKFYKNGKKMDIEALSSINGNSAGATYYYYISIDDFAMLCGMEVDKIDTENRAIYLTMK